MVTATRRSARCPKCELVQFRRASGLCRRCNSALPEGSVTSTTVIMVGVERDGDPVPMRETMRRAARDAVKRIGATTKAADALGISHARLKQLLREGGDERDYRSTYRKPRSKA